MVILTYLLLGHFSKVKIVLTQGKGTTEISLEQTGVPVSDFERTQSGWEQQIWYVYYINWYFIMLGSSNFYL